MNDASILEARLLAQTEGKLRADSKVWHLPDDQFIAIVEWLRGGTTLRQIVELCASELGIPPDRVPQKSALSSFWESFSPYYLIARRRSTARASEALGAEMSASPLDLDAATLDLVKQCAFELSASATPDPDQVKSLVGLLLKAGDQRLAREKLAHDRAAKTRDQTIAEQSLALAKEKFQRDTCALFLKWQGDERAKQIAAGNASNAEKIEQLGLAMFGEDWNS